MKHQKWLAAILAASMILSAGALTSGCGSKAKPSQQAMMVTTIKPFQSDTPIDRSYTGSVMALQEVPVRARVSGTVMEKYISGGQQVTQGQPLFRIDTRTYESQLNNAEGQVAQAQANYANAERDAQRYGELINSGAISQQAYDNQVAAANAYNGALNAAQAQVQLARTNLNDTVVTAPFTGKLSLDDVNVGTYATAGTTSLVTISSTDPIYVQFSMSENEYLDLTKDGTIQDALGDNLQLKLSDGSIYPETGRIVEVNAGMQGGQISMKAAFPNPDNVLVPGMYATVLSGAQIQEGSMLIPTQAIIQLLNKDMVDVVVDGKVQQKAIKRGISVGIYTVVESGLDLGDEIIVAGQNKVTIGQDVTPQDTTRDQLEQQATAEQAGQKGGSSSAN